RTSSSGAGSVCPPVHAGGQGHCTESRPCVGIWPYLDFHSPKRGDGLVRWDARQGYSLKALQATQGLDLGRVWQPVQDHRLYGQLAGEGGQPDSLDKEALERDLGEGRKVDLGQQAGDGELVELQAGERAEVDGPSLGHGGAVLKVKRAERAATDEWAKVDQEVSFQAELP